MLRADRALEHRLRHKRERLAYELVKTLACVVFADNDFSHSISVPKGERARLFTENIITFRRKIKVFLFFFEVLLYNAIGDICD